MFKVGIGLSKTRDFFLAGEEVAKKALAELGEGNPDLCFLFSSAKFANLQMLKGVRSIIPKIPLFGCSDAGEIISEGSHQMSVVIVAIKSNSLNFTAHLERDVEILPRQKGRKIAETLRRNLTKKGKNKEVLILFSDGLSENITDIVHGIQEVLGTSYPILGGAAADNFLFQKTYQYYNDKIFSRSVLGVLIQAPKIGFGIRHGWRPLGRPYKVTRAEKNIIWEINKKPAIEVYQNYFGNRINDLEKRYLLKMIISYPLGMLIPGEKEYLVRNILDIHLDGSLVFSSDIPEGRMVRLMMSNKELAIQAAKDAAWEAAQGTSSQKANLGIIFNSASRRKLLGTRRDEEIEEIGKALTKTPLIGFYGYSQQAPLGGEINLGQTYSHNQAVVILTLGE